MGIIAPPFGFSRQFKALQLGSKFQLPAGSKVAMLGSSSTQKNTSAFVTGGTQVIQGAAFGGMTYARMRDPRFDFTNWFDATDPDGRSFTGANFGYSGTVNSFFSAKLANIIAKGYKAVILQYSQNDMPAGTPVDTAIAQVRASALQAMAAGLGVYLLTLNPRSPTGINNNANVVALPNPLYRRQIQYNIALANLAEEVGAELIDTRPYLVDPASPYGAAKTGISFDGLHLSPLGSYLWAMAANAVFNRTILPGSAQNLVAGSAGNLFANGLLTGTGGSLAGTTQTGGAASQTGTVPNNVRFGLASTAGTSTCVASTAVDPQEGNVLRQVYTLNSADQTATWRTLFTDTPGSGDTSIALAGYAGQWIRTILAVFVESGAEYIQDIRTICALRSATTSAGTTFSEADECTSTSGTTEPFADATANGQMYWFITEPVLVPAGANFVHFRLDVQFGGTGSAVLEVSRPAVRVVPDPRL